MIVPPTRASTVSVLKNISQQWCNADYKCIFYILYTCGILWTKLQRGRTSVSLTLQARPKVSKSVQMCYLKIDSKHWISFIQKFLH